MGKVEEKDSEVNLEKEIDYPYSSAKEVMLEFENPSTEVITGERPAINDIHDMCKCEKLENPNGAKRVGFCL